VIDVLGLVLSTTVVGQQSRTVDFDGSL